MTTHTHVLEIAHLFGEQKVISKHYIEAESVQMVKYWFHRHYKQWGHNPGWATNKHTIDVGGRQVVELEWVEAIDSIHEAEVLRDHLPVFPKV